MIKLITSPTDLIKLSGIDTARLEAVQLDSWTIAMGSMLVCGIRPEKNATGIPKSARLLEDALRHASGKQLYDAGRIMADWIDDHEEDLEDGATGATLVRPMDFLLWCEETLRGKPREPETLDLFLQYVRPVAERGIDRPTPHELLNRVVELEATNPGVKRTSSPVHEFRGYWGDALMRAYAAADAPRDRKCVFRALCELAQKQNPPAPVVGYDRSKQKVIYRDEKGIERLYGLSDLRNRKEFRTS
ncbi:MAG: hypothetical protein ACT6UH_09035 [Hydrogenophaga sp.]|uniref:hypothetical protein n=1 Tax=Hydrogenophaga sp. TaxID=1904254 RepID=UPI004036A67C